MASEEFVSPPLNEEQRNILEALTSGKYDNFAALSGRFQNQDVAYIVIDDLRRPRDQSKE